MKYDIAPNVSTLKLVDAYGHYARQDKTINVSPSFSISKGILSIAVFKWIILQYINPNLTPK